MHFYLLVCAFVLLPIVVNSGRIDAAYHEMKEPTVKELEKPHIAQIMERIMPSVSEDSIKILKFNESESVYSDKAKGRPSLFRKLSDKLHAVNTTEYNENDYKVTTELNPLSTSHSHIYERTAKTKTTVHQTKKDKKQMTTTTTEKPIILLARARRSFTKEELESFSDIRESFKKFNENMHSLQTAEKEFTAFMTKLDDLSAAHDKFLS